MALYLKPQKMKLFAMLMLRCAFIMHLSSLFQNGTLATLKELQTSYRELKGMREEFNTFIIEVELELIKQLK
uniref:Uncharacterized protein n=1 Tax=Globodera pallida TaxID=36090 RepID=A0A183BP80_GLOPA